MAKALVTTRASVAIYNLVDDFIESSRSEGNTGVINTTEIRILKDGPTPVNSADEIYGNYLRSRINWTIAGSGRPTADFNAGASSAAVANIFQVIKVPDRTVLHELMLAAPTATAPTNSWTGDSGASTVLNFQAAVFSNASKSTLKFDADGLGLLSVTNSGGAVAGFPTVSASTPETRMKAVSTSAGTPLYFPWGGYVEMQFSGGASTSALSADGVIVGSMELVIRCSKLPE